MDPHELAAWLRLVHTPGVGPVLARRLLQAFGLPQQVLDREPSELQGVVPAELARALRTPDPAVQQLIERTWRWLTDGDAPAPRRVLTWGEADYPPLLLDTPDPPPVLYVQGMAQALRRPALAVVGSRNPTPQGQSNARAFAAALAGAGWTVVSGLALGVDAAAHQGALDGAGASDLATVAVVGTGLDRVYPRQNHALAHAIAQRGALVSEYPLGTPPLAQNFPRRNRLIAGLTRGTLVVEAALQSGSLITARLAAECGREVFAIPGSIHSVQARGCHRLIRDGAKLVESVADIFEELGTPQPVATGACGVGPSPSPAHACTTDPVLQALGHDPVGFDELLARTGLDASQLQVRLLELELQGEVARLPGGRLQRQAVA